MNNNGSNSSGEIGFCGLLTIVFIILKLCKVITWSWWWVLSPLWIGALLSLIIIVIYVVILCHEDKSTYTTKRRTGKWKF